jgi:small conductance mechanosensitive channel
MTKDFSYYLMDVGVAYREDVDEVMNVLRAYPNNPEALKAMRAQAKWRNAR